MLFLYPFGPSLYGKDESIELGVSSNGNPWPVKQAPSVAPLPPSLMGWCRRIVTPQNACAACRAPDQPRRAVRTSESQLVVVSPPASRGIGPQHQHADGPLSPSPSTDPEVMRPPVGGQLATGEGGGDKLHDASSQHHGQEGGASNGVWDLSRLVCLAGSDARPLRPACL